MRAAGRSIMQLFLIIMGKFNCSFKNARVTKYIIHSLRDALVGFQIARCMLFDENMGASLGASMKQKICMPYKMIGINCNSFSRVALRKSFMPRERKEID
jgi:hypothetical protein